MEIDSPLAPMIRKLNARGSLSAEDIKAVLALPFRLRSIPAHGYVIREGDGIQALNDIEIALLPGDAIRELAVRNRAIGEAPHQGAGRGVREPHGPMRA